MSLSSAIDNGFGIETDIRDYRGKLVISHNVADDTAPQAETFFAYYADNHSVGQLALSVKADSIQMLFIPLLEKCGISDYFLFDMSVPETVAYCWMSLKYYTDKAMWSTSASCLTRLKASGWTAFKAISLTTEEIKQHYV